MERGADFLAPGVEPEYRTQVGHPGAGREEAFEFVRREPQREGDALAGGFLCCLAVVAMVQAADAVAVFETEREALRRCVPREVECRERVFRQPRRIPPAFARGQRVQPGEAHDTGREVGAVLLHVIPVADLHDLRRGGVGIVPCLAERGPEEGVAQYLVALSCGIGIGADAPLPEGAPGSGIETVHGAVAFLVAPRAAFVYFGGDVGQHHGLREIAPVAPVGRGSAAEKFVGGFDADGLGLLLGVEPQVEEVLQRFEQCRLPDRMPGDVGESDCGAVARCRREPRSE